MVMVSALPPGLKITTIFCLFGLCPGVMIKWSKILDHDYGQYFEIRGVR